MVLKPQDLVMQRNDMSSLHHNDKEWTNGHTNRNKWTHEIKSQLLRTQSAPPLQFQAQRQRNNASPYYFFCLRRKLRFWQQRLQQTGQGHSTTETSLRSEAERRYGEWWRKHVGRATEGGDGQSSASHCQKQKPLWHRGYAQRSRWSQIGVKASVGVTGSFEEWWFS